MALTLFRRIGCDCLCRPDRRLKSALKSLVRLAGYLLVNRESSAARYIELPPRGPFDEILLRVFSRLEGLRFIQVGANDGVLVDPIFRYITAFRWQGVLVEPMPGPFALLEARYSGNPRLTLLNAAVDDVHGTRELFHLKEPLTGLPEWTGGLPSFFESRLVTAAGELGLPVESVTSTRVNTVTWSEVWTAFGGGECDLLVTDTEGDDIRILRQSGLREHRPRVLLFEHACVGEAERWAFYKELADSGYELATSEGDTVAWRSEAGAKP